MSDFLLSFEFSEDDECLMIHGDEKGLNNLCSILQKLILNTKEGYFNHDHLWTPAWGGHELSAENQGGKVINGVKVYCWKGSELQK